MAPGVKPPLPPDPRARRDCRHNRQIMKYSQLYGGSYFQRLSANLWGIIFRLCNPRASRYNNLWPPRSEGRTQSLSTHAHVLQRFVENTTRPGVNLSAGSTRVCTHTHTHNLSEHNL